MVELTSNDGVVVNQEGSNVRARAGRLDFLFLQSEAGGILRTYEETSALTREHFEPRWKAIANENIDAAAFAELVQECSLHWMYFYINNRLPLEIGDREWDHPQTRRIIELVVERRFPRGSDEPARVCGQLMGISVQDYRAWSEGEEWRRGIM